MTLLDFFKTGGVFLFNEDDPRSERTFYALEDLMGEEEGADLTETSVGPDEQSLFYDGNVLSEEQAVARYEAGQHVTSV